MKQQSLSIQATFSLRCLGIPARLWIVGEALLKEEQAYRGRLQSLVESLNAGEYILFLGHRNDVLQLIEAADVLVLTSKYEGLPNVLVEAGMAGRPAVSFPVCGAREVLADGITGYIVRADHEGELVSRLISLAQDPYLRWRIGEAAKNRVSTMYRLSTTLDAKMAFYREQLGEPHGELNGKP